MTSFDAAFELLIGNEGGYSNNPNDTGGETMWGITRRVAQAHGYTGIMKDLPQDTAKSICKTVYWDTLKLDLFPPAVAFQILDTNYNGGHAVLWMAQAAGVKADGVMSDTLVTAVNATDPMKFIMRFIAYRQRYLVSIKSWPSFGRGWINRTSTNLILGAK